MAALWCTVRALERARAGRGTRWLVAAGVCVGLGFETKMLVALVVVPGIAAAWLWLAPAGRADGCALHALGQLLAGGMAMVLVGGAWPLLVELTPAADRPWVSGTSDNRVLSLIFEYNGLGRVDGQTGGPGGVAGNMFGGATGSAAPAELGARRPGRLVARLRAGECSGNPVRQPSAPHRRAQRLAAGGGRRVRDHGRAVQLRQRHLPPVLRVAAGAVRGRVGRRGAAQLFSGAVNARVVGPLAVLAGVVVELIVRADYSGQLTWLPPVLIVVGLLAALALLGFSSRAVRMAATAAAVAALLAAPAVWAFDTLGHATSSTFPAGGPASAESGGMGGPGGGPGGGSGGPGRGLRGTGTGAGFPGPGGGQPPGAGASGSEAGAAPRLFGSGAGAPGSAGATARGAGSGRHRRRLRRSIRRRLRRSIRRRLRRSIRRRRGRSIRRRRQAIGAPIGGSVSASVESYVKHHGGGTIAVSSQSNAASAILDGDDNVAGIGGFSGRESEVTVSWLAQEIRAGKIRWVLDEEGSSGSSGAGARGIAGGGAFPGAGFGSAGALRQGGGAGRAGLPGDTRVGAKKAMAAVAKACTAVTISGGKSSSGSASGASKLYDCAGRAAALESVGTQQSSS